MIFEKLIGNTPIIKITYKKDGKFAHIYAKLEYYNFTGSIKDRIAYEIITRAKEKGILKNNMPIVEVTSGNTGISLAAMAALYNHPVHIFIPDWVSSERIKIMEMYGANVHLVSRAEGGFQHAIKNANEFAANIKGYCANQFENVDNILAHYNHTGVEIYNSLNDIDSFVSGIGTGGTLIGVGRRLKEINPNIKVYALEPDSLPILTTGISEGTHKIEGIGDNFIPKIVDRSIIDDIILVNDEDAIKMSRLLASKLGIGVGISSGANFIAAVLKNKNNKIVTIFADDNKKYLSTDLSKPISINPTFISNQIELTDFEEI